MWWNAHSHELHVKKNVKFTYMLSAFDMNKFYLHRYLKISCEFVLGEFNLLT